MNEKTASFSRIKQSGLSLIELLISVALGLMITAGLVQLFVNTRQNYDIQSGLARLQENARTASYFLERDVRMAGLTGCRNLSQLEPQILVRNPPNNLDFSNLTIIQGYQGDSSGWTPALPSWLTNNLASGTNITAGTDVLVIRKMDQQYQNLSSSMASTNSNVPVNNNKTITANNIVLITDCEKADIFRASNGTSTTTIIHTNADNTSSSLSKAYGTDAQIGLLDVYAYYIKDTGDDNEAGNPIYALYRQDVAGNEEALVSGVENMKLTFGVDTTNDLSIDQLLNASTVNSQNDWGNVRSVKISLLLTTVEDVNPLEEDYTFNESTVNNPGDRQLRKEFESYINLRNRSQ